ncbi:MAG: phage holin family protein [Burkholderiales bacterium]|nr:phage holin family protein [Burkholderiales bacterium]
MRLLLIWIVNTVTLFVLPRLLDTVQVDSFTTALTAALVLGLVNTLIRPIFLVLTLPITFLTLGLFIFVINGLMFWVVADIVPGFQVMSFSAAIVAAFFYSVISWLLTAFIPK